MEYLTATNQDWEALSKHLPGKFPDNLAGWQYFFDAGKKKWRLRAGVANNDTGSNIWLTLKDGKIISL